MRLERKYEDFSFYAFSKLFLVIFITHTKTIPKNHYSNKLLIIQLQNYRQASTIYLLLTIYTTHQSFIFPIMHIFLSAISPTLRKFTNSSTLSHWFISIYNIPYTLHIQFIQIYRHKSPHFYFYYYPSTRKCIFYAFFVFSVNLLFWDLLEPESMQKAKNTLACTFLFKLIWRFRFFCLFLQH